MPTHAPSAMTAGQNFIAPEAVLLTRTTLPAASKEHMSPAASCLRNVSNAPS